MSKKPTYEELEQRVQLVEAEKRLSESEERFRQLVECSPISVMMLQNGKYTYGNPASAALLGYESPGDIVGIDALQTIAPEFHALLRERMKRIQAGGFNEPMEIKIIKPSGECVWTRSTSVSLTIDEKPTAVIFGQDITDTRKAAIEIQKGRLRHQAIIKTAMDGYWLTDIQGYLIEVNDAYCKLSGYSEAELLRMHISDLEAVENPERVAQHMQRIIYEGADRFESRHRRKNGTVFDVEVSVQYRPDEGGQCVCFLRDITEQKQSEAALKESETKFRTLVDQAPAALFLHDMDGNIVDVNKAALDGYGYTVKQLLQMKAKDIDPDYTAREDKGKFWNELQEKTRFDFEARHRRRDGSLFPVRVSLTPITLNGRRHVFALAVDMTEYKEAQEKITRSQERFRSVFNQAAVGVAIVSAEGFFLELNDKLCEIVGYTRDELKKMTYGDITHPADLVLDENYVKKIFAGEMDAYEIEKRYIHKQGHPVWIRLFSNVLRNAAGNIKYALAIVMDISRQKAAEEERRKLIDRLNHAQRMESIGNLAGGIAHDFNNILFPIVGMSELLMEDFPGNSPAWENAEEIFKAGNRGKDLVRQILAFSRQSEHKLMPTRIQNILKEVIKLARSSIPSYIEINHDVQADCGLVMADPTQMHQVAMNIITNAYHAVDATGGNISITLKETALDGSVSKDVDLRPGKYAVLSISDTGHGMSSDLIKKIFDPYFTTKEKGRGTGLGLAVVHGIVKEHHGDIRVKSEIGKGTTFDVYIPLLERSAASAMVKIGEAYPTGDERILLVDDETPIAKLEKMMLERLGYQVTMRINSIETLNVFKAKPKSFDLVLTDMNMPNMTGDQLAKEIKAIRPDIPIILCTGFSERIRAQRAEHMELAGIIMKPIVKSELAKIVRKVLDEAQKKNQEYLPSG